MSIKQLVRFVSLLVLLGLVTYMSTLCYLFYSQSEFQLQVEETKTVRTMNYDRPAKTPPPIPKKTARAVKPDYTDAAKWYWDIESNSFRRRVLK